MPHVRIPLDGRVRATLDWSEAKLIAKMHEKLIFDLNLGLFQGLIHPLKNSTQYLSLKLSVDHFLETIYPEFKDKIVSLCLWKGATHFANEMRWNEEQESLYQVWKKNKPFDDPFLRDLYAKQVIADYLHLLVAHLPDDLEVTIELQVDEHPLSHLIFLCSPEPFERISLQLKPDLFFKKAPIGFLVPSLESIKQECFIKGIETLKGKTFRLIPQDDLVGRWDELDHLYLFSKWLSPQAKRMVQGFQAAGGEVIECLYPINY